MSGANKRELYWERLKSQQFCNWGRESNSIWDFARKRYWQNLGLILAEKEAFDLFSLRVVVVVSLQVFWGSLELIDCYLHNFRVGKMQNWCETI